MQRGVLKSVCSQQGLAPCRGDFPFRHSPATCHKQGDVVSVKDRSRDAAMPTNQALSLLGCACPSPSLLKHSLDTVWLGQRTSSKGLPLAWTKLSRKHTLSHPHDFHPEKSSTYYRTLYRCCSSAFGFRAVTGNATMITGDPLFSLSAPGQPCVKRSMQHAVSLASATALQLCPLQRCGN